MRQLGCMYVVGQTMKLNETTTNRILQYFLLSPGVVQPVKAKIAYFYEEERLIKKRC